MWIFFSVKMGLGYKIIYLKAAIGICFCVRIWFCKCQIVIFLYIIYFILFFKEIDKIYHISKQNGFSRK